MQTKEEELTEELMTEEEWMERKSRIWICDPCRKPYQVGEIDLVWELPTQVLEETLTNC